eukprot:6015855-Pyramimonas_sp.AAC.2
MRPWGPFRPRGPQTRARGAIDIGDGSRASGEPPGALVASGAGRPFLSGPRSRAKCKGAMGDRQ